MNHFDLGNALLIFKNDVMLIDVTRIGDERKTFLITAATVKAGLDPIYTTDEYPREGCTASVKVQKDGYHLTTFAPNGKVLEGYANVYTPRAISRMLEEWVCGYAPRLKHRLDHSPDKS